MDWLISLDAAERVPLLTDARWEALRSKWGSSPEQLIATRWMGALLATAIGLLLLWTLVERFRKRYPRMTPLFIFNDIATELGLSIADRWLLARVAHNEVLPTPLTLLLSEGTLRYHGDRFARTRRGVWRDGVRRRLARIDARVFGSTLR